MAGTSWNRLKPEYLSKWLCLNPKKLEQFIEATFNKCYRCLRWRPEEPGAITTFLQWNTHCMYFPDLIFYHAIHYTYYIYICTCAIFQLVLYYIYIYIYTYIRTKKWETWKYEVNIIISWFRTFAVGRRRAVGVLREAPQLLRLAPLLLRLQPSAGASHVLGAIAWAISATGP